MNPDPPKEKTRQELIADAERVDQFLLDPAVSGAINTLTQGYIEELINAPHSEDRAKAQSKVQAMRAFKEELRKIVAIGADALYVEVLKERQAELKKSLLQ